MKITKTLFFLSFLISQTGFSQDWIETNITYFASIKLPMTSEPINTEGHTVFLATDKYAQYTVMAMKLPNKAVSGLTLDKLSEFYKGSINGALAATNGEVVSLNEITFKGIPSMEMEYITPPNPNMPSRRFKRIIYMNKHLITIEFVPFELEKYRALISKKKNTFFNSLSFDMSSIISLDEQARANDPVVGTAFNLGYIIAQITFYLFLLGIPIGIILLIKRSSKKKKKKQSTAPWASQNEAQPSILECRQCDTENRPEAKYCKGCGYHLVKK